jgi:SNF2 family DNA or RNA helicase
MRYFLISIRAGAVGISIPNANRVILLDVSWNPTFDQQASARAYRYGQTKPVHVYRFVCKVK